MKITQKKVFEALKQVIDPELGINIVDLGLVYKVEILRQSVFQQKNRSAQDDKAGFKSLPALSSMRVKILMTLTTPGCPLAGVFDQMVREALIDLPGIDVTKDVEIELTFDPPWVESMMTEEARAQLGID